MTNQPVRLALVLTLLCSGVFACSAKSAPAPGPSSDASQDASASPVTAAAATGAPSEQKTAVGGDRDEHGCIASAGYQWCAKENACVRPWELAKQRGFASDQAAFHQYCDGAASAHN